MRNGSKEYLEEKVGWGTSHIAWQLIEFFFPTIMALSSKPSELKSHLGPGQLWKRRVKECVGRGGGWHIEQESDPGAQDLIWLSADQEKRKDLCGPVSTPQRGQEQVPKGGGHCLPIYSPCLTLPVLFLVRKTPPSRTLLLQFRGQGRWRHESQNAGYAGDANANLSDREVCRTCCPKPQVYNGHRRQEGRGL